MGAVAIAGADDFRKVYLRDGAMLPVAAESLHDVASSEPAPAVWLVGAHGGAGVSTLAAAMAPMGDAGKVWPAGEENPYCVVVCRSTQQGLERAHQAALQARAGKAGDVFLIGIVVVADAPGKTPKQLERKIRVIEEHFRVWTVPYIEDFRLSETEALAEWRPGMELAESSRTKLGKKKSLTATQAPPPPVVTVAEELFASALEAYEMAQQG